ncbi:MAG: SNF2-related protein [Gammaproteobacteria bacterium]|jgi:superfamily II DNA or RNA helicase
MPFSPSDLQTVFSPAALDLGHGLVATNAVRSVQQRDGGNITTAIVAACQGDKIFRVYVRDLGDGNVHSECSCGQSLCEHAAAALLSILKPATDAQDDTITHVSSNTTPSIDQQLLYILKPEKGVNTGLVVDTVVVRKLGNGAYSGGGHFSPKRADKSNPARFLQSEDFQILAGLARMQSVEQPISVIDGPEADHLLRSMIQTGRCRAGDMYSAPIKLSEPRPLSLDWVTDREGVQHLQWQVAPGAEYLIIIANLWYIDPNSQAAGNLATDLPPELINTLLARSSLKAQQAKELIGWINVEFPYIRLPQLRSYETKTITAQPLACLRLFSMGDESGRDNNLLHRAELFFTYDDIEVSSQTPATWFDGHTLIHIQRDSKFELQCKRRLFDAGFYSARSGKIPDKDIYSLSDDPARWIDFQYDVVPELDKDNWRILYDPSFQLRAVRSQTWYCDTRRLDDRDWFDFSMGVVIDGERINLLPVLLEYLKLNPPDSSGMTAQSYVLKIQDKQWLRIPAERIRAIINTLVSLYKSKAGKAVPTSLRLPLYQLANISELALGETAPAPEWIGDADLRSLGEKLRNTEQAQEVSAPQTLRAELRHYQQSGLSWLQFLREQHMGGILADDMGLGKTVQTLAHLLVEKQHERLDRPSLIIAPTSLVFNWRNELRRFAPSLSCLCLQGSDRQQYFKSINKHDVVITSYPLLIRDEAALLAFRYHYLILDEAHYIKNPKTKAARCVRNIDARHRLCLTGTPLENHLGELWSLFDFLLPGLLGNQKQFQAVFRTPIEKHQETDRAESLARRVRPFMLRRTKDAVASELPEKTEIIRRIALTQQQQDLYETVRLSVHHHVRSVIQHQGLARSQITVLDALLKLRQVCCDPRLVKLEKPHSIVDSAKLEFLTEILPEMIEEGRRILLFSQFTSMLALIEEEVKKLQIGYAKLTGQTIDRAAQIERFQSREAPLFLISLKAGGVGLNLTAADTVIHYDPWWNPAAERQATDRAHRIGQTQRVFVYKLICEGTVEEKILTMQQHKQSLADSLFQFQEQGTSRWSEQEIDELLAPLE